MTTISITEEWDRLSEEDKQQIVAELTDEQALEVLYDWSLWRRADQTPPEGDWFCWALISGRGAGKSRTGSEMVRAWAEQAREAGRPVRIALVAESAADARDVMVEGDSGILACSPPWWRPVYKPSKRRLVWPDGTQATHFSGDKPDQLRGPQFHYAWVDELAKFQYPEDVVDNLELGLRLGAHPRMVVTTTPRPIPAITELIEDPDTVVTRVSTYANIGNLAPRFIRRILEKYEGTRLGRQELHAEILTDMPGALWTQALLEGTRVEEKKAPKEFVRIVIGVDPAVSAEEDSDETGIVVVGKTKDRHLYVLADASGVYTPDAWAEMVARLYRSYGADRVVAEVNNGGDLVEATLRTKNADLSYRKVHATRGKGLRAEPIAALYEQGKVHHVGMFARMEDQMTVTTRDGFQGRGSPDRMEAAVWAIWALMFGAFTSTDPDDYADSRAA